MLVQATLKNSAILKQLGTTGEILFDQYYESGGYYVLAPITGEIQLLELHEVKVERDADLDKLAKRRRTERAPPRAEDDSDDTLATGFVDHYMDAAEMAARIQALAVLRDVSSGTLSLHRGMGQTPGRRRAWIRSKRAWAFS
jgi:hypothetical protein